MMRYALVALAAFTAWNAQASTAGADPVADIGALIANCEAEQEDAKCAAQFWNFADLTADNRLTVAEITRFFRLLVEYQANQTNSAAPTPGAAAPTVDPFEAVAVTFLVGPVAAGLVVDNFDYNGNRWRSGFAVLGRSKPGALAPLIQGYRNRIERRLIGAPVLAPARKRLAPRRSGQDGDFGGEAQFDIVEGGKRVGGRIKDD